jgi:glucosyl-dolichyl phosphate glucuronosyltransferase
MTTIMTHLVIICRHMMRIRKDIRAANASSCQQTQRTDQIALVIDDNAELLGCATPALSHGVLVVGNHRARGLSGAGNTGIAAATGGLIAFIDDDAIADVSWPDIPVARCKGPDIFGASSWIDPLWVGLRPAWLPEAFLSAANSGFATVKFDRHGAIAKAMLRAGRAQ